MMVLPLATLFLRGLPPAKLAGSTPFLTTTRHRNHRGPSAPGAGGTIYMHRGLLQCPLPSAVGWLKRLGSTRARKWSVCYATSSAFLPRSHHCLPKQSHRWKVILTKQLPKGGGRSRKRNMVSVAISIVSRAVQKGVAANETALAQWPRASERNSSKRKSSNAKHQDGVVLRCCWGGLGREVQKRASAKHKLEQ